MYKRPRPSRVPAATRHRDRIPARPPSCASPPPRADRDNHTTPVRNGPRTCKPPATFFTRSVPGGEIRNQKAEIRRGLLFRFLLSDFCFLIYASSRSDGKPASCRVRRHSSHHPQIGRAHV